VCVGMHVYASIMCIRIYIMCVSSCEPAYEQCIVVTETVLLLLAKNKMLADDIYCPLTH